MIKIIQSIDINLLAIIISAVILTVAVNRRERGLVPHTLFLLLVSANILLNAVEILAWISDAPVGVFGPEHRIFNVIFNLLNYALATLPVLLWLLYANYQLFHDNRSMKKTALAAAPFMMADILISVLSVKTGWYFGVDLQNSYQRGPLFFVHVVIVYGMLAAVCLMVLVNRRMLEKRTYRALLLFNIPPVAGSIIQITLYGLLLNWVTMMISLLIIYLFIQDRGLNTDYLTGTYNRRHFESLIKNRIRRSAPGQSFALILADLDNFKKINDQYGHQAGDDTLKTAVTLIRRCLRHDDMIARYGGDEFIILLDLSEDTALRNAMQRIYGEFERFSGSSGLPYPVSLSMGGLVYDPAAGQTAEQFLHQVDELMYQEKSRRNASKEVLHAGG